MYVITSVFRNSNYKYLGRKYHVHLEDDYSAQWGGYWYWRRGDAEAKRDELNATLRQGI